jgi:hypothetical protein
MVPIRMVSPRIGMRMELVSYTADAPDPAQFDLPANLKVIPIPALPIKPGGGSTHQQ